MRSKLVLCGVCAIGLRALAAPAIAMEPLHYEPVVVRLSGNVVIEEFYGRPNYGEDPDRRALDEIERAPILHLDEPFTVVEDPNSDINSETVADVTRTHLVVGSETVIDGMDVGRGLSSGQKISELKGHHVVVEGTLFRAHTAHHHTDVLMSVNKATIDR